jgi:hypothetical protein
MDAPATASGVRLMNVAVVPGTKADSHYTALHDTAAEALAPGFAPTTRDLEFNGGRTIADLTYTNFFLGGESAWNRSDVDKIDGALDAAMSHVGLNNMLAQYYDGRPPTTTFHPSRILEGSLPPRMFKDQVEELVLRLFGDGTLADFDLQSSVFNFLLPSGIFLSTVSSTGAEEAQGIEGAAGEGEGEALPGEVEEEDDSAEGLGGYHGSAHPGGGDEVIYYSVGVFSERRPDGINGIPVFPQPWKNVVATFYHELVEARTDPDVDDVHFTPDINLLGWYSFAPKAGEIGDIPMHEAEEIHNLHSIFVELPANGGGTIPIQLMYSNAVHGPEGPVEEPRQPGTPA